MKGYQILNLNEDFCNTLIIIVLFTLLLQHLFMYYGRKKYRHGRYHLYLVLFLLSIIIDIILSSNFVKYLYNSNNYQYFNAPILNSLNLLFMYYTWINLMKNVINQLHKKVVITSYLFIYLSIFISAAAHFNVNIVYLKLIFFSFILFLLLGWSISIFNVLNIFYKNKNQYHKKLLLEKKIILFSSIIFILYSILDQIFNFKSENNLFNNHILYLIFFLFLSYILIKNNNRIFHNNLNFKNKLRKANMNLKDEILKKTKRLKQSVKLRKLFFIQFAQEIKIPLSLISNLFEVYLEKNKPNLELLIIKKNIDKMKNDMINYIDLEKLILKKNIYNHNQITCLSSIVNEKIVFFDYITKKKKINLTTDIDKNIYTKIDINAIDRILDNLLDNAVKFTHLNGKIEVKLKDEYQDELSLTIKDSGIGMNKEKLSQLFKPFNHIPKKKNNSSGMGLGLNIVKNIIDTINGSFYIDSKENEGTTIKIKLNRYVPLQNEIMSIENFSSVNEMTTNKLMDDYYIEGRYNIMLIGNNIQYINYLSHNLSLNYNTFLSTNLNSALEKMNSIPKPNIIIFDISLDALYQTKLLDEMKQNTNYSDSYFIYISPKVSIEEKIKSLFIGEIEYITKPFLIEELIAKINLAILDKKISINSLNSINILDNNNIIKINNKDKDLLLQKNFEYMSKKYNFTKREHEIAFYTIKNASQKEIADNLNISIKTVSAVTSRMYKKTNSINKISFINKFNLLSLK